ncbi:hypothetical protein LTR99_002065 [Exophiala xenobiotica]|nr:hypothetical protein LTR96_002303 [Exophiala xenobiotica]KAK5306374.1 hypothetical protein LTR99_002065 [Exophiala xenobiotica]KAK5341647.1 hypothetical protein LTR98_002440 [Exophiala xenobiotica]KAK5533206.1 hypothetical protein LTR23_009208 [Chaetothyriales sp. CCFEE 6169]
MDHSTGFGKNRLATGFRGPSSLVTEEMSDNNGNNSTSAASPGVSADDAIEISSDEESEDGGMVINVDHSTQHGLQEKTAVHEDDHTSGFQNTNTESSARRKNMASPSNSIDEDVDMQLQAETMLYANSPPNGVPADAALHPQPGLRLRDLSPDQLQLQLKYALFDVHPEQVDLDRPVVCLTCLSEGHAEEVCPERICVHCSAVDQHPSRTCPQIGRCSRCREPGHDAESCTAGIKITTVPCDLCGALNHVEASCPRRFFLSDALSYSGTLKLWISCCRCASKSHLVGDCPDAKSVMATRWSLKPLSPGQVVNLSLESGTAHLELEAANRGMRPAGMRIKGRAGLHTAGVPAPVQGSDDDTDEPFLGPRVGTKSKGDRAEFTFRHPQRPPEPKSYQQRGGQYDRYNPPLDSHAYQSRPASNWYATDSFGGRRSRSPPSFGRRGAEDPRRRSRSPRGFDSYRSDRRRSPHNSHDSGRPTPTQTSDAPAGLRGGAATDSPHQGPSFQLPLRRGSNNMPPRQQTANPDRPLSQPVVPPPNAQQARSKKKKKSTRRGVRGRPKANKSQADGDTSDDDSSYSTHDDNIAEKENVVITPKIFRKLPPVQVLEKFVKILNAQRELRSQSRLELESLGEKHYLRMESYAQNWVEITTQQRAVIWKWLEAVQSLAGAAKQTLHTFLLLQDAPALDRVYLDETMAPHLTSRGWKRKGKENLHQLRDPAPVVEHLQLNADPEAVAAKMDHANSGSASHPKTSQLSRKSTLQLPMAPDLVLQLYLKMVSMQRDKAGQAPVVLGLSEEGRRVFIDLSGPDLKKPVDQVDLQAVWRWADEFFLRFSRIPRSADKKARWAYDEYKSLLAQSPVLRDFIQGRVGA